MQFNLFRKSAVMLALMLALMLELMLTAAAVSAQTARPRPKVVTNTPASFQYAHQHGYKAGYEDGHIKGRSDFNETKGREIESSDAYQRADRGYLPAQGTRVEYQEGYRIGFEMGYNDGYFGRPFTTSQPANLRKVVVAAINSDSAANAGTAQTSQPVETPTTTVSGASGSSRPRTSSDTGRDDAGASGSRPRSSTSGRNEIVIRDGVSMKVRLTTEINTKVNKEGDKFTALVLDPTDYADAEVTGHIAKLNRSGKASGKTELSLVFDSIRTRDGREGRMAAQVEKVYESESVKTVDDEGNVETGSRTKDTATRSAGGAVLGAIIGGIAGGGKGAAIGAAIGAGAGVGSVFIQGGKDLILSPGTEILIRTAAPAKTRD